MRVRTRSTLSRSSLAALALILAVVLLGSACSVRKVAVNSLGDALARGGAAWSSDDDPDLIRDAMPFALKTTESLLAASPKHKGLLLLAASSFTQYTYAFVQCEADYVEPTDLRAATEMRARASRLYRRAQGYGLRGLEVDHPGFVAALGKDRAAALASVTGREVPLLYWTAMAWAAQIALAKDSAELTADLPLVAAMMDRAKALDPAFGEGAIFDFYISYEGRSSSAGGSAERARAAFDEAMQRAGGRRVSPLVGLAESVAVPAQDRAEFTRLLKQAVAVDADSTGEERLVNLVAQKRARWLLSRVDDLFIE
jgi:predicted anti-sigma-YlaC factor YlaD